MTEVEIIAEHHGYFDVHRLMFVCRCGMSWPALSDDYDREIELHAAHQVERLRQRGHTIVRTEPGTCVDDPKGEHRWLPTHSGWRCTDCCFKTPHHPSRFDRTAAASPTAQEPT